MGSDESEVKANCCMLKDSNPLFFAGGRGREVKGLRWMNNKGIEKADGENTTTANNISKA